SWYGCCEKIRERVFASSSPAGSMTVRVMNGSRAGVVPPLTDRMVANGTTCGWSMVWPLSTRASRWLVRIRSYSISSMSTRSVVRIMVSPLFMYGPAMGKNSQDLFSLFVVICFLGGCFPGFLLIPRSYVHYSPIPFLPPDHLSILSRKSAWRFLDIPP